MQDSNNPSNKAKPFSYYMRALHRDIGFFVVGLILLYAFSGVILIYRDHNFLKLDMRVEKKLPPNLDSAELGNILRMRDFAVTKTEGDVVYFKNGTYNRSSGLVAYTTKDNPFPLNKIIALHKTTSNGLAYWFTTGFGLCLSFLAISSFWMFGNKTAGFRRGVRVAGAGILFATLLLCI